jgi:uncharacterized protein YraI
LQVTNPNLNIGAGPSIDYPLIGKMKSGDRAIIAGRNADSSWWLVAHYQSRGWAISDHAYSQVVGDTSNVLLVATPLVSTPKSSSSSLPRAFVTALCMRVQKARYTMGQRARHWLAWLVTLLSV